MAQLRSFSKEIQELPKNHSNRRGNLATVQPPQPASSDYSLRWSRLEIIRICWRISRLRLTFSFRLIQLWVTKASSSGILLGSSPKNRPLLGLCLTSRNKVATDTIRRREGWWICGVVGLRWKKTLRRAAAASLKRYFKSREIQCIMTKRRRKTIGVPSLNLWFSLEKLSLTLSRITQNFPK